MHTSTNLCPYNPCSSCTDVQYNAQYHPHDQHSYSVLHEYLLCRCCCIPLRDVCADQRTSDLALVVCFWKHFLVLYVPVLWMVSFTEDINEQPWGLHEHPTVQYKQHLSRDHSELWAKFSIEMLYDCRGMWENAVIWKPWICEFFGIPITNPDPDNLALFQCHSLPEYRCWPCPSL